MLKVSFIRHSITEGNKLKRYIGITDEPLCKEGIELLAGRQYPDVDWVYESPMIRCKETAQIIYPDKSHTVLEDFREISFGDFENKNYMELSGNPDYQAWIDSNGTLPFPNGEPKEKFDKRCMKSFYQSVEDAISKNNKHIAIVVHGGTIMTIMNVLTKDEDYYKYMTKNGEGYTVEFEVHDDNAVRIATITPIFEG